MLCLPSLMQHVAESTRCPACLVREHFHGFTAFCVTGHATRANGSESIGLAWHQTKGAATPVEWQRAV